jgi:hypothetical protein
VFRERVESTTPPQRPLAASRPHVSGPGNHYGKHAYDQWTVDEVLAKAAAA